MIEETTNLNLTIQYTILAMGKTHIQQNHQNTMYKNVKKENVEQLSANAQLHLNLKFIKEPEKQLRNLLTQLRNQIVLLQRINALTLS